MSDVTIYLEALPAAEKAVLEAVCKVVRQVAPGAEEVTSYGVPSFKVNGKLLLGFAHGKHAMSIYPTPGPIAAHAADLASYTYSKGAIQFTTDHPLSSELLERIVRHRLAEITG